MGPKKATRPRVLLSAPTDESGFVGALQAAYVRAGQPELRAFCASHGLKRSTVRPMLIDGRLPTSIQILERLAKALGLRLVPESKKD